MFPHYSQNSKKRQNHEIPSIAEIEKRKEVQETSKRTKTDFFRNQAKEQDTAAQNEEQRRLLGLSGTRTALRDTTNKSSSDTSSKEIDGQGKRVKVEENSSDQTKVGKEQIEKDNKENAQSLERRRLLRIKDRSAHEISPSLPENLKHISSKVMQLQEVDKLSMTDRAMENRGVDPEKFRRVSQELSNAMKNGNPDHLRISTTKKEFREMAEKLGLIRPEI